MQHAMCAKLFGTPPAFRTHPRPPSALPRGPRYAETRNQRRAQYTALVGGGGRLDRAVGDGLPTPDGFQRRLPLHPDTRRTASTSGCLNGGEPRTVVLRNAPRASMPGYRRTHTTAGTPGAVIGLRATPIPGRARPDAESPRLLLRAPEETVREADESHVRAPPGGLPTVPSTLRGPGRAAELGLGPIAIDVSEQPGRRRGFGGNATIGVGSRHARRSAASDGQ